MKYSVYFILIPLLLSTTAVNAATERYRVEVLVLTHLGHDVPPREAIALSDYSAAQDLLEPPPAPMDPACFPEEPDNPEEVVLDSFGEAGQSESGTETDPLDEETRPDPNALVHIREMGPEMQDAWRRLRLSGPFRPLQYLAWEQGSEAPFPTLRIHDETVVLHDDPYSDLRIQAEAENALTPVQTGPMKECPPLNGPEELPGPTLYYALDGAVSLVRTRFLHLNLDLQWRETIPESLEIARPDVLPGRARQAPAAFRVHDFRQSRQVRSGRMEYFDGPVIGVLAWLTAIPLEDTGER